MRKIENSTKAMMRHEDEEGQQAENSGAFVSFISLNERSSEDNTCLAIFMAKTFTYSIPTRHVYFLEKKLLWLSLTLYYPTIYCISMILLCLCSEVENLQEMRFHHFIDNIYFFKVQPIFSLIMSHFCSQMYLYLN